MPALLDLFNMDKMSNADLLAHMDDTTESEGKYSYPSPDEILEAAEAEAPKLNLRRYRHALGTLRAKGYSFGDIAKWMSERLGAKVTRSQVAYVLTSPTDVLEMDEEDDDLEREADQWSEEQALGDAISSIDGKKVRG